MGGKGVLKKGEEKEYSKRGRKRSTQKGRGKEGRKRPPKFANSKTDGRLGGNSQILKAGGSSVLKLPDYPPMLS